MANYTLSVLEQIDFAPGTETAEIIQNVRAIISTRQGDVPLDRNFGIPWEFVDMPLPVARATMTAAVIDAINEYEPRATVKSVSFEEDASDAMDGLSRPRVVITIGNQQEEAFFV